VTLTQSTRTTIGAAASVAVVVGGFAWAVHASLDDVSDRLGIIEQDRLGLTRASELAARAALENPGLRIPDPRDPNRVLVARLPGRP
jgi:hypothetical protein